MEIIVLEGLPNKGKTETIGIVYDLVINAKGVSQGKSQIGKDPRDFEDIVTGYKSKKIAFYSAGDQSNFLANAVRKYAAAKCDLLICALSLNGRKVNANKAINKYVNTRVPKTVESNPKLRTQVNNSDAQRIFTMI
ncbi:hypothetical protein GN157_12890 [Flavobacterium rakeshii]|uniref:Uncharacterized protein n=1 Tax=Flavobacterium rakeshii TaxID=1038845 RepID=A0A6N8HFU7_9FLAO|nr:hypothetical protein [Flavobacterium rakeshii]MUV04606.1 hypothetical protein [Flavobacterium rakeshii]